jgi:hypothetical protein
MSSAHIWGGLAKGIAQGVDAQFQVKTRKDEVAEFARQRENQRRAEMRARYESEGLAVPDVYQDLPEPVTPTLGQSVKSGISNTLPKIGNALTRLPAIGPKIGARLPMPMLAQSPLGEGGPPALGGPRPGGQAQTVEGEWQAPVNVATGRQTVDTPQGGIAGVQRQRAMDDWKARAAEEQKNRLAYGAATFEQEKAIAAAGATRVNSSSELEWERAQTIADQQQAGIYTNAMLPVIGALRERKMDPAKAAAAYVQIEDALNADTKMRPAAKESLRQSLMAQMGVMGVSSEQIEAARGVRPAPGPGLIERGVDWVGELFSGGGVDASGLMSPDEAYARVRSGKVQGKEVPETLMQGELSILGNQSMTPEQKNAAVDEYRMKIGQLLGPAGTAQYARGMEAAVRKLAAQQRASAPTTQGPAVSSPYGGPANPRPYNDTTVPIH